MNTPNTGNHAQNPATTSPHGANGQNSGTSSNADIFTLNAQIEAPARSGGHAASRNPYSNSNRKNTGFLEAPKQAGY